MARITDGEVAFSRSRKMADYENAKADARLVFQVGEDEDFTQVFAYASDFVVAEAHRMVGLKSPIPAPVAARTVAVAVAPVAAPVTEAAAPAADAAPAATEPRRRPGRPPKVKPVETAAAAASMDEEDAAAGNDPAADVTGAQPAAPAAEPAVAGIMDDLDAPAPSLISDDDLMKAITERNAELQNPLLIRELVAKYVTAPKRARDIPQEQRQAFISSLRELK